MRSDPGRPRTDPDLVRALLERFESIEQVGAAPDAGGLVLWSPARLEVRLHESTG